VHLFPLAPRSFFFIFIFIFLTTVPRRGPPDVMFTYVVYTAKKMMYTSRRFAYGYSIFCLESVTRKNDVKSISLYFRYFIKCYLSSAPDTLLVVKTPRERCVYTGEKILFRGSEIQNAPFLPKTYLSISYLAIYIYGYICMGKERKREGGTKAVRFERRQLQVSFHSKK